MSPRAMVWPAGLSTTPSAQAAELDTRMILLGQGWSAVRLRSLGLLHPAAEAANEKMRRRA